MRTVGRHVFHAATGRDKGVLKNGEFTRPSQGVI